MRVDKLARKYIMLGVDAILTVTAAFAAVLLRFEGVSRSRQGRFFYRLYCRMCS